MTSKQRWWIAGICVVLCLYAAGVANLSQFSKTDSPNTGDEFAVLFQAKVFSKGWLWAPAPPHPQFFKAHYVAIKNGKWYGQFPPLPSLVLAPFVAFNQPTAAMGFLSALTLALFIALAYRIGVSGTGIFISTALLAFSPSYLFHSASYYTHIQAALMVLVALHAGLSLSNHFSWRNTLFLGVSVGVGIGIRPYTFALLAPLLLVWPLKGLKKDQLLPLAGILMGALVAAVFVSFLHSFITEDALSLPYWSAGDNSSKLQFAFNNDVVQRAIRLLKATALWVTADFSDFKSSAITATDYRLGASALLSAWACALVFAAESEKRFWLFVFLAPLALLVGHAFFAGPTSGRFGGRYLFEALPLLALALGHGLSRLIDKVPQNGGYIVVIIALMLAIPFYGRTLSNTAKGFARDNTLRMSIHQPVVNAKLDKALIFIGKVTEFDSTWFVRNEPDLSGIIYAVDRGAENATLTAAFPDHPAFLLGYDTHDYKLTPAIGR